MAWYNIFRKAAEIDRLENELDFSRRQLQFAQDRIDSLELKNELLEKTIKSERAKHDKFVAAAMDKLTKNTGTFQKIVTPPEPQKEPEISEQEMLRIEAAAQLQRDADVASGYEPQNLDFYVSEIKKDPARYLPA